MLTGCAGCQAPCAHHMLHPRPAVYPLRLAPLTSGQPAHWWWGRQPPFAEPACRCCRGQGGAQYGHGGGARRQRLAVACGGSGGSLLRPAGDGTLASGGDWPACAAGAENAMVAVRGTYESRVLRVGRLLLQSC